MKNLIITLLLLTPGTALASSTLFTLSSYNGLVFGSFSDPNADFGGGIAAGGTLAISGTDVADALLGEPITDFPGQYTLVSGGNLTATNGTESIGNVYGGGSSNTFNLTLSSGYSYKTAPGTADPLNFSAQQTSFQSISTALSQMASTGSCTYDGYSTTTCTASNHGANIINVSDPTILGSNRTVNIKLAYSDSYVVFNVAGSGTDTLSNYGFNVYLNGVNQGSSNGDATTTLAHNILFNYYQATTLDFSSVVGSVLAPLAASVGTGGQIDGTLVANSFTSNSSPTEFHNFGYEGPLPSGPSGQGAAPEPGSWLMIGLGMGLIGAVTAKKKRAARG